MKYVGFFGPGLEKFAVGVRMRPDEAVQHFDLRGYTDEAIGRMADESEREVAEFSRRHPPETWAENSRTKDRAVVLTEAALTDVERSIAAQMGVQITPEYVAKIVENRAAAAVRDEQRSVTPVEQEQQLAKAFGYSTVEQYRASMKRRTA